VPVEALDEESLPDYLRGLGLIGDEPVEIERAGDGNINWVRRVRAGARSWVVKQARPTLERFPEYRASTERIVFEARWLETVRPLDRGEVCPAVAVFDAPSRTLVLEDLGEAPRLDAVLAAGGDGSAAAARIAGFLGVVHAATRAPRGSPAARDLAARFANDEMRRLHGDHVFVLPFLPNDFPLAPAVRARAEALWRDGALARKAAAAYRRYLEPHGALVHGDAQAGNVLLAARGAVLLDAEIAHLGDPAFDLGTLLAHLWLPAVARRAPSRAEPAAAAAMASYRLTAGSGIRLESDARGYAAIEMLRRTLGAARVPVAEPPEAALAIVDFALGWLGLTPPTSSASSRSRRSPAG
jgi:5-methylthioribose kinase